MASVEAVSHIEAEEISAHKMSRRMEDEAARLAIANLIDPDRLRVRPGWDAEANCKGMAIDSFEVNSSKKAESLRPICEVCPVASICLAEAFATNDTSLFRGNTTPRERNIMLKKYKLEKVRQVSAAKAVQFTEDEALAS